MSFIKAILKFFGFISDSEQKVEPVKETPPEKHMEPEIQKPSIGKMTQLKVAYLVAQTQIGVKEIVGSKHNAKVVEYHQACTLQASDDETAWCSSFVNWCYIIAGIILNPLMMLKLLRNAKYEESDIRLFLESALKIAAIISPESVDAIKNMTGTGVVVKVPTRSAMARSWLGFGKKTSTPSEGDLGVYERGNNGYSGHIGFIKKSNLSYDDLLGGNQSNEVNVTSQSKLKLLAYITEA